MRTAPNEQLASAGLAEPSRVWKRPFIGGAGTPGIPGCDAAYPMVAYISGSKRVARIVMLARVHVSVDRLEWGAPSVMVSRCRQDITAAILPDRRWSMRLAPQR